MRKVRAVVRVCGVAGALLGGGGCDTGRSSQPRRSFDEKQQIFQVSAADQAMNAAVARARATARAFLPHLRNPPQGQSYLGVKAELKGPEGSEHIWLYDIRYEGDRIVGRLRDDAEHVAGFRQGDEVRVRPEEVSDWMTIENGQVCGGFTSRILVADLPPAERARWMQGMGVERMPEGDAVCVEGARL